MQKHLVFTFIADDKPGLVGQLSQTVANHDGNWLDSRMSRMAGKFAGIVRVAVDEKKLATLHASIEALESEGMKVVVEHENPDFTGLNSNFQLDIIGADRTGIVREISQALSAQQISVGEMHSSIGSAPMAGYPTFEATATIFVPGDVDVEDLDTRLQAIAEELAVDISLSEAAE